MSEESAGQRLNVDASAFLIEINVALNESKNRVVVAHANIAAWMPFGADLSDENVAWEDEFATELLDATSLGVRITTVTGRTLTFFVCHC